MKKSIVQTEEYREIEKRYIDKATTLKNTQIDRSLPYEEQGRLSHINELAYTTIMGVVKMVRKEIEEKFKSKINLFTSTFWKLVNFLNRV